ncbi:TetR/AcrR family transcriptional regulator [Limnochorda pilosa]|uniref:TetR/AcrR family transcriptional regulator n=1 Tax=Limnochorda pilosa TaxID=1555112 RepID=UPI0009E74B07
MTLFPLSASSHDPLLIPSTLPRSSGRVQTLRSRRGTSLRLLSGSGGYDPCGLDAAVVLEAARRVFATQGFKRASLDDVARKVGIGRGTIYRRFPTKEALLEAVVRLGEREVIARHQGEPLASWSSLRA